MAKGRRTNERGQNTQTGAERTANGGGSTAEQQNDNAQERIAARAYELYLARGRSDGQDWDDWLTAERELSSRDAASSETPRGSNREDSRNAARSEPTE
jgi:hypothetical protein